MSQLGGGFYCHRKAIRSVVHLSVHCVSGKAVPGHRAVVGSALVGASKPFPKVLAPVAMVPSSERERARGPVCSALLWIVGSSMSAVPDATAC